MAKNNFSLFSFLFSLFFFFSFLKKWSRTLSTKYVFYLRRLQVYSTRGLNGFFDAAARSVGVSVL